MSEQLELGLEDEIKIEEHKAPQITLERTISCIKACEGITTEALSKGFYQDLFEDYFYECGIDELEALLKCTEGKTHDRVIESVNNLWDEIDAIDLAEKT